MSKARRLWNQPLRLTSSFLVLAGAVTVVGACNSGDANVAEQVALARQGLNWAGGCACLPIASCPTLATGCVRAPTSSDGCSSASALLCERNLSSSWCFVKSDKTACPDGITGKTSTCDGGYCGTCPGCYIKTGLCFPGTAVDACGVGAVACDNCNDSNECTKDTCATTGRCMNAVLSNQTACTGGLCFGGACCTGCYNSSGCQSGTILDACGAAGAECKVCEKPSNPCLRAICSAGGCSTEPVPSGTTCSDGDVCNGDESCDGAGNCVKGTAKDCTTSDPCLIGKCDPSRGCVTTPNTGGICSDGNACTIGDKCDTAGACIGGPLKPCTDSKVCTDDKCDPATGNCLNPALPDTTPCDDGADCTTGETCQAGVCKPAGTVSCDDGVFCTKDTVVCPGGTCKSEPAGMDGQACVPTDKCFYNGTCNAGDCRGGTAVNCDDGKPCTKDGCDPLTGCTHTNEPATTLCVDGNPCTTDDRCRPLTGQCAGTPIVCAALDDCHAPGTCDAVTGRCDDPRRVDGFPCLSNTGRCAGGICVPSATGGAAGAAGVAGAGGEISAAGAAGAEPVPTAAGGAVASNGGATGTTGSAGESALGGTTGIGGKTSSKGGSTVDEDDVYQRNPGGCSCSMPGRTSSQGLALFGLLALALGIGRKRRR
jgi:MYXO-CTERM domain-containing protein